MHRLRRALEKVSFEQAVEGRLEEGDTDSQSTSPGGLSRPSLTDSSEGKQSYSLCININTHRRILNTVQILNHPYLFTNHSLSRRPPVPRFSTWLGSWMPIFSRSPKWVPGFRGRVSLSHPWHAGRKGCILGGPCGSVSSVGHGKLSNPANQHWVLGWDYPSADRSICHQRLWKHGGERNGYWSWKRSDSKKKMKYMLYAKLSLKK